MDTAIVTAVGTAVSNGATSITSLVGDNLPILLGVTLAFVGLGIAKRFVRSLAS